MTVFGFSGRYVETQRAHESFRTMFQFDKLRDSDNLHVFFIYSGCCFVLIVIIFVFLNKTMS